MLSVHLCSRGRNTLIGMAVVVAALVTGCAFGSEPSEAPAVPSDNVIVSPIPTATLTSESAGPPADAASDSALAAVDELVVQGRGPKTGYDRDLFGTSWIDTDGDGCDTRNQLLRQQLTELTIGNDCRVLAGILVDPFTGRSIRFEYGGTSEVDVDHIVSLSDAWQKGASRWTTEQRIVFANDPLNLQPTDAAANRQKGDGDTATWLPPNTSYRCTYVVRQVAVKTKYEISITPAERDAMVRVLSECPDQTLPR